MDRETEAAPAQAPPTNGLPPIFQRPTYPSGEPATKAPERPPEEPSEPRAPREPRQRGERTEEAPAKRRPGSDEAEDGAPAATGENDSPAPRRRSRGGRGRGGRGRGGAGTSTRDDATVEAAEERPARTRAEQQADGAEDGRPRRQRTRGERGRIGAAEKELEQTPESQRDDAQPDGTVVAAASGEATDGTDAPKRRRRRGGRGRKRSGIAEGAEAPARPERPERQDQERHERPERSRGPKTLEEQVASGGPTRGLRSRTLRGRSGRRQREPQIVPPRITDKLMVITEHGERDQIAVLEENTLVQHYVTRRGSHSMVGNVYLGRIQNVLPGMEAAFVDIGRGRNGVLYAGEVNYSPEDLEGGRPPRIERVLKSGQSVMVQVTKDPMGGKGARLTAQISLPGRFLVLAPDQDVSGISRRLSDEARKRLKAILNKVKPKAHGVIVRTAAEGASEEEITHDLERLVALWNQIQKTAKKVKAPDVLYEEPELTVRVVRDLFTDEEFRGLVTDSERVHDKVMEYVRDVAPDLASKVKLHRGPLSAFEEYRIVEQIHKALDRKVWLPSGGYLIIEQTEAMTIVDVNTGKAVGKTNLEETVLTTNLEAAKEVARQLRLRDIGGIIVIDFIDLLLEQNKRKVEDTMRETLAIDKTRSQVFEIGPLGIMQITRKRVSGGLVDSFSETCPQCEGRGIIVNYDAS
ncbi:MAG: ribonuclease, Rne/Rng family [Actinomycetia bacterium]|jgi:ribonuclease E|nr:ribonuclease, Rne/Rng family [Actinomycetes bacterium]